MQRILTTRVIKTMSIPSNFQNYNHYIDGSGCSRILFQLEFHHLEIHVKVLKGKYLWTGFPPFLSQILQSVSGSFD